MYLWIAKRSVVEIPIDGAHSIANYCSFGPISIVDYANGWFAIQKPVLENENWGCSSICRVAASFNMKETSSSMKM